MKRKVVALLIASMVVSGLAGCGTKETSETAKPSEAATTATTEAPAAPDTEAPAATETEAPAAPDTEAPDDQASGDLIKVGIINNDPNESGYRTANDKDLKEMFTEANG